MKVIYQIPTKNVLHNTRTSIGGGGAPFRVYQTSSRLEIVLEKFEQEQNLFWWLLVRVLLGHIT